MPYYFLWTGDPEPIEHGPGDFYPGEPTLRLEGGSWGGVDVGDFTNGVKLVSEPALPIAIETFGKGLLPPAFVVPALVVRKDFAEALRAVGVDNIDYYPAVLHDPGSAKQWDNYLVGNVLGLMDVIDMNKSVVEPDSPPGTAMLFETMVVDEGKCRGEKLFRLAQKPSRILVSEEVRDYILGRGFRHVTFIPPEDFA